jgi:hypothetical protein
MGNKHPFAHHHNIINEYKERLGKKYDVIYALKQQYSYNFYAVYRKSTTKLLLGWKELINRKIKYDTSKHKMATIIRPIQTLVHMYRRNN